MCSPNLPASHSPSVIGGGQLPVADVLVGVETLARIVRQQVNRDRLAASLLEERHDPVPVRGHPAGAGD